MNASANDTNKHIAIFKYAHTFSNKSMNTSLYNIVNTIYYTIMLKRLFYRSMFILCIHSIK